MGTKLRNIFLPISSIFLLGVITLSTSVHVFAADGSIGVQPSSKSVQVGTPFDVEVVVKGGGIPFNAAEATVIPSSLLSVKNVTLGNCGFAFVNTPTIGNPSFTGVILGDSSLECTAYTLTLEPKGTGTGSINFLDASIKAYENAEEIFSTAQNGTYTISQAVGGSTSNNSNTSSTLPQSSVADYNPPTVNTDGVKLYNLTFSTPIPKDVSKDSIQFTLNPNLPNSVTKTPTVSPDNTVASVTFENVPEGVHTVTITNGGKILSKQVLNIAGEDKNIAFTMKETEVANEGLPGWVIVVSVIALIALTLVVGFFGYRYIKNRYF